MKAILSEEFKRMQKLAGLLKENINSIEKEGEDEIKQISFPISDIEELNKYVQADFKRRTGEIDDRHIKDIASSDRAADLEEEMFAIDIIKAMKQGRFTSDEVTSNIINHEIYDKYWGESEDEDEFEDDEEEFEDED